MSLAAREVLGRAMPRPRVHDGNERLVAALCRGDADAFATLVDRHSPAMIRVAMAYVPSRAAAEEAVQERWIAVIRGIERSEGRSSLKTWIFRILTNVARAPAPASGGACRSRRSPRRRTPVSRRSTPIASCRPTTSSSPVTGRSCRRAGRRPFNRLQPAVGDTDAARDQRVERGVDLSEALRTRIRLLPTTRRDTRPCIGYPPADAKRRRRGFPTVGLPVREHPSGRPAPPRGDSGGEPGSPRSARRYGGRGPPDEPRP